MSKLDVVQIASSQPAAWYEGNAWHMTEAHLEDFAAHILEEAAWACYQVAKDTTSAGVSDGASECYRRVLRLKP